MSDEGRGSNAAIVKTGEASARPSCVLIALLALFLPFVSCGYRFTPVGGILPEGSKTIAIITFVNGTDEPYVDVDVTRAVVDEFLADGRLSVVGSEAADLVLRGVVTKFAVTPSAYSTDGYAQSYTVRLSVNMSLEDAKTRKIIWQEKGLGSVFVSGYGVTLGDITTTKIAKEAALKSASRDLASTLRSRLLEGF